MHEYVVQWSINVDADNPEEAAQKALEMMPSHDETSIALVFDVYDINSAENFQVDLWLEDDDPEKVLRS